MFLRKPSSIRLLAAAEKAEADADAALAVVSKARSKAMRQRFLAARVEAEEDAVRLEKTASIAASLVDKAVQEHHFSKSERDRVHNEFLAAQGNVERAKKCLVIYTKAFDTAITAAKAARAEVPKTESTE